MSDNEKKVKSTGGFYSKEFTVFFRGLFLPVTKFLKMIGFTPNKVTLLSLIFAIATGALIVTEHFYFALVIGVSMGLLDIIDGQMAKDFNEKTSFGAVFDSTIDRYVEFIIFFSFGLRYYLHERYLWIILCSIGFLGSIMISYIKARAEAEGFECKVGRLQRPERLTIMAFGVLFKGIGIDVIVAFFAVSTQFTSIHRLVHVYRQSKLTKAE